MDDNGVTNFSNNGRAWFDEVKSGAYLLRYELRAEMGDMRFIKHFQVDVAGNTDGQYIAESALKRGCELMMDMMFALEAAGVDLSPLAKYDKIIRKNN